MEVKITIDDELGQAIQKLAAGRGVTVSALVEKMLRDLYVHDINREREPIIKLCTSGPAEHRASRRLPSHGQGGLKPGIDLDNMAATLDILDEYDAAH